MGYFQRQESNYLHLEISKLDLAPFLPICPVLKPNNSDALLLLIITNLLHEQRHLHLNYLILDTSPHFSAVTDQ
jgi:hypothetical protein